MEMQSTVIYSFSGWILAIFIIFIFISILNSIVDMMFKTTTNISQKFITKRLRKMQLKQNKEEGK